MNWLTLLLVFVSISSLWVVGALMAAKLAAGNGREDDDR
jgi:hypothetical protein